VSALRCVPTKDRASLKQKEPHPYIWGVPQKRWRSGLSLATGIFAQLGFSLARSCVEGTTCPMRCVYLSLSRLHSQGLGYGPRMHTV